MRFHCIWYIGNNTFLYVFTVFAGDIFSGTADGKVIRIKADLTTEAVVSLGSPNCGKIKTPCNTLLKVLNNFEFYDITLSMI